MKKIALLFCLACCSLLKAQTNCHSFKFDITDSVGNTISVSALSYTIMYHGTTKKTDTLKQFLTRDTAIDGYSLATGCDKDTVRTQKILIHQGDKSMVIISNKRGFPSVNDLNQEMQVITIGFKPGFTFYWDGDFDKAHNMRFRLVQGIKTK